MRTLIRTTIVVVVLSLAFPVPSGHCRPRAEKNLCEEYSGKKLNTYLADPTDATGKAADSLKTLKGTIEDSLLSRLNIDFDMAGRVDEADITISCNIKEYELTGTQGRVRASFSVADIKKRKGKIIWERDITASIGAEEALGADAAELLNEKLVQNFMKACFAKKNLRAAFPSRSPEEGGSS
jgi:hypothetical protein